MKFFFGIFFEILMVRFLEWVYIEFDKDDVEGSIKRLEKVFFIIW